MQNLGERLRMHRILLVLVYPIYVYFIILNLRDLMAKYVLHMYLLFSNESQGLRGMSADIFITNN